MYSSPVTPGATGCSCPSSSHRRTLASGRPIGTTALSASCSITWKLLSMVASVGP
ncbi:hypothetical protein D3C77_278730 [compost metagenome]